MACCFQAGPQATTQLGQTALGLYGCLPYGALPGQPHPHPSATPRGIGPMTPITGTDPAWGGLRWYLHFPGGLSSPAPKMLLLLGWWGC